MLTGFQNSFNLKLSYTSKLSLNEDRGHTDRVSNWDPHPNPNLDL